MAARSEEERLSWGKKSVERAKVRMVVDCVVGVVDDGVGEIDDECAEECGGHGQYAERHYLSADGVRLAPCLPAGVWQCCLDAAALVACICPVEESDEGERRCYAVYAPQREERQ